MSHEYFKVGTTQALINAVKARIVEKPDSDALSPLLTAGAALGITGEATDSAAWLQRTSTSDGPTTIRSIHGNTIVQDGELLPVNMAGIETTGFNQWDEQTVTGYFNNNGVWATASSILSSKNPIPVLPSTTYYLSAPPDIVAHVTFWKSAVPSGASATSEYLGPTGSDWSSNAANKAFTTPADCRYIHFNLGSSYGTTYQNDICINLSSSRNGTYEPHWQSERSIDAATYFPDGMRGAGTVYDELTKTQAITRIGERSYQSGDESDATVTTDGTVTHYALATPTTVEIDPPLNMTYRTEQGGTERVMVPTGEISAPPTIVTAQGYTAESLRDAALSTIAPVENGLASTNYGVGSYLVHGGQLCKVTTAIATGESISIGTNVTATTVMAEVLSLTQ